MKLLIVEDDERKLRTLATFVEELLPDVEVVERHSYQSGLREAVCEKPAIILLDMSLPTFDPDPSGHSGRHRYYAGREMLKELVRRRVPTRAIVVTQFDVFGEGQDQMTLLELESEMSEQFGDEYLGTVYYHPAQSTWRDKLGEMLQGCVQGGGS